MEKDTRARLVGNPAFKVFRWTMPWVALVVVLYFLSGYWVDFKRYKPPATTTAIGTETSTVEATGSVPATGSVVVTLMDGVRIRTQPSANGQVVAAVGKGTLLTVLEGRKDWLRVRDPLGRTGWVTSSAQFIQAKKK